MRSKASHSLLGLFFGGPPFVFYLALSLWVLAPCLLFHRAYFDSDLLAQFGPWRSFLKDELAQGRFPLWDPYLLGGQPFFADLQNMMLYPLNYLTLPFSIPLGLTLFTALHWAIGALGMEKWLSTLGLAPRAARVGALLFALSGFFWMELIHPPVLAAFAWLPWWFASLEILSRDLKAKPAFLSGLALALLFLCGSFQVFLGAFYAGAAYLLLRLFQNKKKTADFAAFARVLLFFLAGSFPIWGQLIPTLEFFSLSSRNAQTAGDPAFNASCSLNPAALDHALFPTRDLPAGQWLDHAVQNDQDFLANSLYLGVWIPVLCLLAFRKAAGSERLKLWFFMLGGLLTLALCFGGYFYFQALVVKCLPGFKDLRAPYRFSYLWIFFLATLGAFGWQALETLTQEKKIQARWIQGLFLYALVLLLAALSRFERTDLEIAALLGGALGIGCCLRKKSRGLGLGILEAALILPLLLRGWEIFCPAPYANFDFAANSSAIVKLTAPQMPGRVMMDPRQVPYPIEVREKRYVCYYPENLFAALRLKDFGGYNPLSLQAVNDIRFLPSDKIFKLMAIQGFLTTENAGLLKGFAKKQQEHLYFYQSLFSGALVFAPTRWQVLPAAGDRLGAMKNPGFDPYQEGLLSEPLPESIASKLGPQSPQLHYQVLKDEPSTQSFQVSVSKDTLAVFSEAAYPGWKAWVDGTPAPLFTADHALRAVFIPEGSHKLDFRYEPPWGPWIFLPWAFTLAVSFWLYRKKDF